MSKSKKKPNEMHLQKIAKAQHRNEFITHIKQFCNRLTDSNVFQLIPAFHLEEMYKLRTHPIRIRAAEGQQIPAEILQECKEMISAIFKKKPVNINVGSVSEISLYDFFTIGLTLMTYGTRLQASDYPAATEVKSKLMPYIEIAESETYNSVWNEYFSSMNLIGIIINDLRSNLYSLKHETRLEMNGTSGMFFCMEIYRMKTEEINISIDGNNRPVFRLGWLLPQAISHLDFITVKSEDLNLPAGNLFDVYLQSHALKRLAERIDGVTTGFLHFSIFDSFKNLKICKNKNGDLLFEFALLNKKVGYFKGDIINGKIILRTFLFLTNNGTPEGEKLHKNTGIMKEDKKYLIIDKFSAFIDSDISASKHVKDIFINAGCESLFEIDDAVYLAPEGMTKKVIADRITKHLKLDHGIPNKKWTKFS